MEILDKVPSLRDIIVPFEEEEDFCRRNHVRCQRLQNGAVVLEVPSVVEDQCSVELDAMFPSGSYHDPKGKSGIHHLLEHLMMAKISRAARKHWAGANALTHPNEITFTLEGVANPKARNYGVWPVLPVLRESLADPLAFYDDLEGAIEREKEVVYAEIRENRVRDSAHKTEVDKFWREVVFPPDSPRQVQVLGTEADLSTITRDDLLNLSIKIFVPRGMLVSLLTFGKRSLGSHVTETLLEMFSDFPRADQPSFPVDRRRWELLNPNLVMGNSYFRDTGLGNNLVTVDFVWLTKVQEGTVQKAALRRLVGEFDGRFFHYYRSKGLGYSGRVSTMNFDSGAPVYMDLQLPSEFSHPDALQRIISEVKSEVIELLDWSRCQEMCLHEQLVHKARPTPRRERFNSMRDGLKYYDRMVDIDKMKGILARMSASDLWELRNFFLSAEPAIVAVGDLKSKAAK